MNLALLDFHPSIVCGPFSHYNEAYHVHAKRSSTDFAHYYQMLVDGFTVSSANIFVRGLLSPGFAFVFIVFLLAVVYTLRSWGRGYLHTIEELYHFLQLERKDRDFLLEAIYHFAKRASKELEMTERIQQKWNDVEPGSENSPYHEETMIEGVFKHRRGTLATLTDLLPVKRDSLVTMKTESANDNFEGHGTLGKQVKKDFDWLPSQWRRRERRHAVAAQVVIKPDEVTNFQEIYRQVLARGMDISTVDDNASAIIKTTTK